jgi:hypothetical protein
LYQQAQNADGVVSNLCHALRARLVQVAKAESRSRFAEDYSTHQIAAKIKHQTKFVIAAFLPGRIESVLRAAKLQSFGQVLLPLNNSEMNKVSRCV